MLVSPNFLFRVEYALPDRDGIYQLDAYSRAARLSFLLWNSMPDNVLLLAAENGELYHREGLERQIERMLGSPKLEDGVRAFFWDMLAFDSFDTLIKDPNPVSGVHVPGSTGCRRADLAHNHRPPNYSRRRLSRSVYHSPYLFNTSPGGTVGYPIVSKQSQCDAGSLAGVRVCRGRSARRTAGTAQLCGVARPSRPDVTDLARKGLARELLCQEVPKPPQTWTSAS